MEKKKKKLKKKKKKKKKHANIWESLTCSFLNSLKLYLSRMEPITTLYQE